MWNGNLPRNTKEHQRVSPYNKEYCCSGGFVAVATKLGLQTGVAVSCQLRKLIQLLASDAVLMRQVGEIEKILQRQPPGKRK